MELGGTAPPEDTRKFFSGRGLRITFNQEESDEFDKVAELLQLELCVEGKVSEGTVRHLLLEAIVESRESSESESARRFELASQHLFAALGRPIRKWTFFVPVVGLYDDCLPLSVGQVTFWPSTESLSARLVKADDFDEVIPAVIRAHARKQLDEEFGSKTFAEVRVKALEADTEAATTLGLAELELTMDATNFFADLFRPQAYRARVELADEVRDGRRPTCAVMCGEEATGVALAVVGALDNVWLPRLGDDDAIHAGFDRCAQILSNDARSELEQRLLAALRWVGRATAANRPSDKLLWYVMGLEALLVGPAKVTQIAKTFESRAAQLLANDNSVSRANHDAWRLYDLRSRLVHTGWAEVLEDDISCARHFAKACVMQVLTAPQFQTMQTNLEFDAWFAKNKSA